MSRQLTPDVIAQLQLNPDYSGSAFARFQSGDWRTILNIGMENFSARIAGANAQTLEAGAPVDVVVQLLFRDTALPKFQPGTVFRVWEGGVIGSGVVLALVDRRNE